MLESQIISGFGTSVRTLRHKLGMSQEELAERAGLHRTYIAGIEGGGRNVTLKSIEKLAGALRVSIADLLLAPHAGPKRKNGSHGNGHQAEFVDILMVEDNTEDAELTISAFRKAKMANPIQVVSDGKDALDYLFYTGRFARRMPSSKPLLVLLDLDLPKIDGIEVLRRIKADPRTMHIPVVILTASHEGPEMAECKRRGADCFIVKPLDFQSLGEATPWLNLQWALMREANGKRAKNS